MKKVARGFVASVVAMIVFMASAVRSFAQEGSVYEFKEPKHNLFFYVPLPVIIFGSLVAIGMYLVYHYWANGRLRDDMS
jgi:hypothetical protein